MGQFVSKDAHSLRKPIHLLPRQKSEGKGRFGGVSGAARCLNGRLDLHQCQPRMIEKGSAGVSQLDAARAADKQLYADLIFKISDLSAQRGLGRMQPAFRRHREAACLGDRDEIAKMAQLQAWLHACEAWSQAYKVFFGCAISTQILDHASGGKPAR